MAVRPGLGRFWEGPNRDQGTGWQIWMAERGGKIYLVKWKNYGDEENSWEPCTNIEARNEQTGFEDNMTPKEILEVDTYNGRLMYRMSWQEQDESSYVDLRHANAYHSQLVRKFLASPNADRPIAEW